MSGVHRKPTHGGDYQAGTPIDQIVANHFGGETQLASLELSTEAPDFGGACDTGFSCVYTNTISWRNPTDAVADAEQSAHHVRADVRRQRQHESDRPCRRGCVQRGSVLDSVLEKARALSATRRPG